MDNRGTGTMAENLYTDLKRIDLMKKVILAKAFRGELTEQIPN